VLIALIMATSVWQRFGHLRIYVVIDDLQVGWSDPLTGRFVLSRPKLAPVFWAEVDAACQELRQAGRLTGPPLPPQPAELPRPRRGADRPPEAGAARDADLVTTDLDLAAPDITAPDITAPGTAGRSPAATVPDREAGVAAEAGRAGPSGADQSWADGDHRAVRDPGLDDLARNKPGQAARARGRELRREHLLLTTVADLLGIRTQARSFAIGAWGERVVGRKLDTWAARHGWHVLHAVPVGRRGTDIDHVVIGEFGVVTVNTKVTGTSVWVGERGLTLGGKAVPYVQKSRAESVRASRLLSSAVGGRVPVQPVIVFVGAKRFARQRGGPPDVAVLRAPRDLRRWLRRQRRVLAPDQVELIYQAARDPATWQSRRPRRPAPPACRPPDGRPG